MSRMLLLMACLCSPSLLLAEDMTSKLDNAKALVDCLKNKAVNCISDECMPNTEKACVDNCKTKAEEACQKEKKSKEETSAEADKTTSP